MTKPVISIIIPIYKIEKYLHRCIDSIINQSFGNFELILINDGSPDNSKMICENYVLQDNRITLWNQTNKGVSAARNLGLDKAQGEYVLFIDGDDWIDYNMLELLYNPTEEVTTICGMMIWNGINSSPQDGYSIFSRNEVDYFEKERFIDLIGNHILHSPCGKLYKRMIIEKYEIRFNETISYNEDFLFNIDYFIHEEKCRLINKFSYNYIRHIEGSSSDRYHQNMENYLPELLSKLQLIPNFKATNTPLGKTLFELLFRSILNIMHKDNKDNFSIKYNRINEILNSNCFSLLSVNMSQVKLNPFWKYTLKSKNTFCIMGALYIMQSIKKAV